jgi:hypothetical protein
MFTLRERFQDFAAHLLETAPDEWPISEFDLLIYEGREPAIQALRQSLEQLSSGRGFSADDPLTGIGSEGFYLFTRTFGFELAHQMAHHRDDGILDRMRIILPGPAQEQFELYNLVPPYLS